MATKHKVLPDTNIIAYLVAYRSNIPEYRIRANLIKNLIKRSDVTIILYEEQKHEIQRAVKDLIISGKIRGRRQNSVEKIRSEINRILNKLELSGKLIYIPDTSDITTRAVDLYAILEKHRKIHRKISADLEILAAAEKADAAVVTRDSLLYQYYRDILHSRVSTPSMYYLSVNQDKLEATYHLCGQPVEPIETALQEACRTEHFTYSAPRIEC